MNDIVKVYQDDLFEATYTVEPKFNGIRLDQYLMELFENFSREFIKNKIKNGEVRILGRPFPHKPSVKIYEKEKIKISTRKTDLEDEYWQGHKIEINETPEVVFEDENIIVCSKPAYMSTHPTGRHLFNCATVFFEKIHGHTIHSLHRLDRETSGILMLGKKPEIATLIGKKFEMDEVKKCYFFIAHKRKNINFPFMAHERMTALDDYVPRLFVHCFPENSNQGKEAQTYFEKLEENDDYILGLAFPITGRQHQIRAHASFHGFPLLGDKLYNGDPTVFMRFKDGVATENDHLLMQIPRHALHAIALTINYKDKNQLFVTHMPHDFIQWMDHHFPVNLQVLEEKIKLRIKNFFKMI
jgi:23S rRNA pseudouridine1911/1915/1917 synthase